MILKERTFLQGWVFLIILLMLPMHVFPPISTAALYLDKGNIDAYVRNRPEFLPKPFCLPDVVTCGDQTCLLPETFLLYVVMTHVPGIMNKTWQMPVPGT